MRFEFQLGRGRSGTGPWGVLPRYNFSDWRFARESPHALEFRPSLKTVLPRLALALIMAACIAFLYHFFFLAPAADRAEAVPAPVQEAGEPRSLREEAEAFGLSPEQIAELERNQAERLAGHAARQEASRARLQILQQIMAGFMALLGLVGALPLLVCLWNRVRVEADGRGQLRISTWVLWPRTRTLPLHAYDQLHYGADEIVHRGRRHGIIHTHYWRWFVQILPAQDGAGPTSACPVTFHPHQQADRPGAQPKPPERVVHLVEWLLSHKQMQVRGPFVHEEGRSTSRYLSSPQGTPVITRRRYESLEEMPAELRARAEQMRQNMPQGGAQYQYKDHTGQERVYGSLEEMPPEVRAFFERMKNENR